MEEIIHSYRTRSRKGKSKRKRDDMSDDSDSDIDDRGNISGLIDYNCSSRDYKSSRVSRRRNTEPSENIDAAGGNVMNQLLMVNALQMLANKYKQNRDGEESNYSEEEEYEESSETEYTREERQYLKGLSKKRKNDLLNKEELIDNYDKSLIPLRFKILDLPLSISSKSSIMKKYDSFSSMENNEGEYHKLNMWFSDFNKIPFKYEVPFPLKVTSKGSVICEFLSNARKTLDDTVYGHEHVKDTVIQILSQWLTNPCSKGTVIALQGPMGNGKTTLVKKGLAKVLQRPFALIALGGAKDSSFLQGHEYTYEGAKCGRIVEILQETQCMNPIIFFDELDKLSSTANGSEISNLLCHITDPVQNSSFHDRYFSGIDFDISKCVFVMSFNDETKIDSILKDRMNVIHMKGFDEKDKIQIAKRHLIPDLSKEFNFPLKYVNITDSNIKYIIGKTPKEEGVRMLRQHLGFIISKMNTIKLLSRIEHKMPKTILNSHCEIQFPITDLTEDLIDSLLEDKKDEEKIDDSILHLYM